MVLMRTTLDFSKSMNCECIVCGEIYRYTFTQLKCENCRGDWMAKCFTCNKSVLAVFIDENKVTLQCCDYNKCGCIFEYDREVHVIHY